MDVRILSRLNKTGETKTFDRKIECNCFQRSKKANAELVKDICAMANNGSRVSYIVVGISDDGREYRSVRNRNLTNDNLQSLIKTSISPVPATSLKTLRVTHKGKVFELKVITIGKNKRQAFRLATDFIDHKEGYAFRRNEVWIRRGATSDIATPEEIVRLQAGEDLDDPTGAFTNLVYARSPVTERKAAILETITHASDELAIYPDQQLALMNVSDKTFVLRMLYLEDFPLGSKSRLLVTYLWNWGFEHGLIVLSPVKHPPKYFAAHPFGKSDGEFSISSSESWGWFGVAEVPGSGEKWRVRSGLTSPHVRKALKNGLPLQIPIFVLTGIKDVHTLVRRVRKMVEFAHSPQIAPILLAARCATDDALGRVVRERRAFVQVPFEKRLYYEGKPHPLSKGRTVNSRRFGKDIIVGVVRDVGYLQAAKHVRACARLQVASAPPPGRVLGESLVETTEDGLRVWP